MLPRRSLSGEDKNAVKESGMVKSKETQSAVHKLRSPEPEGVTLTPDETINSAGHSLRGPEEPP